MNYGASQVDILFSNDEDYSEKWNGTTYLFGIDSRSASLGGAMETCFYERQTDRYRVACEIEVALLMCS